MEKKITLTFDSEAETVKVEGLEQFKTLDLAMSVLRMAGDVVKFNRDLQRMAMFQQQQAEAHNAISLRNKLQL